MKIGIEVYGRKTSELKELIFITANSFFDANYEIYTKLGYTKSYFQTRNKTINSDYSFHFKRI